VTPLQSVENDRKGHVLVCYAAHFCGSNIKSISWKIDLTDGNFGNLFVGLTMRKGRVTFRIIPYH
jgi:hypothetical protein